VLDPSFGGLMATVFFRDDPDRVPYLPSEAPAFLPRDPSLADGGLPRPLTTYQTTVRGLSDRLVRAQRPIRILDAIKWDDAIERDFFATGARELPRVDAAYYQRRPLPFDPASKRSELTGIQRDIRRRLGPGNPAGRLMARMCLEYLNVIDLLEHRGLPTYCTMSRRLYGSASDTLHSGDPTLGDLGQSLGGVLDKLSLENAVGPEERSLDAAQTIRHLSSRLAGLFGPLGAFRVKMSDGIVADAAAGSDYIKVRRGARFSPRDVRLLEVHEGWVHLGTTLNGQLQPVCTFLSKGPPSSTLTQEGLAVLTELLAFASHPGRVRRLINRVEAIALAEAGANFLDIYRFFLEEGADPSESYQQTVRIFRGSLPEGVGPFTKDLCYTSGLVQVFGFLRLAVRRGMARRIPLLFCGKTNLSDIKILDQLVEEGLVAAPRFLPPPFADLHGLSAWLCYANFLGNLSSQRAEADFARLF
jgi:uncharacterized protein (TIGR02421 family)